MPMEFGFNFIPLAATAGTTVTCNFQPHCDPVRQSDWRACLVAVNTNGDARYSTLWNMRHQLDHAVGGPEPSSIWWSSPCPSR